MIRRLAVVLSVWLVAACAGLEPTPAGSAAAPAPAPTVVLISIDGFRADYLDAERTPALARLAAEGASGTMRPSFPTVTFPNHYTLVTGLHPDRHGIVSNTMEDPELGRFALGMQSAVTDRRWWDDGEPLWVTAERAGIVTGTLFWPGSEAPTRGVRPSHWLPFDQAMPGDARVDRVLDWLDLPEGRRPRFVTLYFDIVDSAGHNHGPDGAETLAAIASTDASIGRLVEGLERRGRLDDTVLVVVSDHGMAATSPDRAIYLDDLAPAESFRLIYGGAFAAIAPTAGREAEAEAGLLRPHPNMSCWRKGEVPARFAYGTHRRVAPIVCSPRTGWLIATRARPVTRPGGAHGFDNEAPEMAAILIARGPGVARGVTVSGLDSVDVHPLLGRLLGLAVPAGDGRPEDTLAIYPGR